MMMKYNKKLQKTGKENVVEKCRGIKILRKKGLNNIRFLPEIRLPGLFSTIT